MTVRFQPTGEVMNTDLTVFQYGPSSGPFTQPEIGNDGWGGPLTGGSLQSQVGPAGGHFVVWKDGGTESTRTMWRFETKAYRDAAVATIEAQLAADAAAIVIDAEGELVTPS